MNAEFSPSWRKSKPKAILESTLRLSGNSLFGRAHAQRHPVDLHQKRDHSRNLFFSLDHRGVNMERTRSSAPGPGRSWIRLRGTTCPVSGSTRASRSSRSVVVTMALMAAILMARLTGSDQVLQLRVSALRLQREPFADIFKVGALASLSPVLTVLSIAVVNILGSMPGLTWCMPASPPACSCLAPLRPAPSALGPGVGLEMHWYPSHRAVAIRE